MAGALGCDAKHRHASATPMRKFRLPAGNLIPLLGDASVPGGSMGVKTP
jgi:hypothetical protein